MRTIRLVWSERFIPLLSWLPSHAAALKAAGAVDAGRGTNPWYAMERAFSELIARSLESWRIVRDEAAEVAFQRLYPA